MKIWLNLDIKNLFLNKIQFKLYLQICLQYWSNKLLTNKYDFIGKS